MFREVAVVTDLNNYTGKYNVIITNRSNGKGYKINTYNAINGRCIDFSWKLASKYYLSLVKLVFIFVCVWMSNFVSI